ncbi:MAG TPA: TonB-dependent receptor [Gemmatimonadaceae bacterium]|nr:TonB-dependent receptor [Gemmatimonadaceae bacterium]
MSPRWPSLLLTVSACAALRATAQVPAELRGRVTDDATGQPIARAGVSVAGGPDYAITSNDGLYQLRGLDPGRYQLRIRAVGYAPVNVEVDVANGRATTADATLHALVVQLSAARITATTSPAGAASFDRAAIEESGKQDLAELLQQLPSVVITRSGGPGAPAQVSIRGSSAAEVLVIVDGVPINSPMTGVADLSRIALSTVERVTVLPGAQSARYGPRALAGVVLIETRRPEQQLSTSASAGSWGEHAEGATIGDAVTLGVDQIAASLTAEARDLLGDFTYPVPAVRGGGIARRMNEDVHASSGAGTVAVESARAQTRARVDWDVTSRGVAGSIVQPSSTGRANESRVAGGLDTRVSRDPLTFSASVDAARERSHFADPDPPFGAAYDDHIDAMQLRGSASASLAGAFGSAALTSELRDLGIDATALSPNAPPHDKLAGLSFGSQVHRRVVGGIGIDVDAALRVDHDSRLSGTWASPRISVGGSRGHASLSVSAGGAFSPPSLADQFFHEGVLVRPNPNLGPERVRHEIEGRLALRSIRFAGLDADVEAAVFQADVSGMILWMPDFRFVWSPSNFDVRRSGAEASGGLRFAAIGAEAHAAISHADVQYARAALSGQVAYRPRTTGDLSFAEQVHGARLAWDTRYVGERRTIPGSSLNALAPYWLSDASFAVPVHRAVWSADATLGVDDIFDRNAAMLVDYPFGGRRWRLGIQLRRGDSPPPTN